MATKKDDKPKVDKKRAKKASPTMRELGKSGSSKKSKPRILKKTTGKAGGGLKKARNFGKLEYHPIKLPDNRFGRILGKRVRLVPKFFPEAWAEIKQTTWPGTKETYRLTVAVFVFSTIFAVIVALLDFGLGKLFKELILG